MGKFWRSRWVLGSRKYITIFFTKLWTKHIVPNITTFILVNKHFFWEITKEVNYLFWVIVILRYSSIICNNFSVPTDLYNGMTPAFKMNAYWKSVLWQNLSTSSSPPPTLLISLYISWLLLIQFLFWVKVSDSRLWKKIQFCIVFPALINKIRLGVHRDSFFLTSTII